MTWRAWELDAITWGWIAWLTFGLAWESYALYARTGQELTEHLRPVFLTWSFAWFVAFGMWLFIGVHLLAPRLETWLLDATGGL